MRAITLAKNGETYGQNLTKKSFSSENNDINKNIDGTLRKSSRSCM